MLSHDDGKFLTQMIQEKPPTTRDKYIDAAANTVRDSANRYLASTNFFGIQTDASKQKASQEADALVNNFYNAVDKSKVQSTKDIDDLRDHIIQQGATQRYRS